MRRDAGNLRRFGPVRLQELAPGRQVVEEVVHLDDGAWSGRHLLLGGNEAAVHPHLGAAVAVARTRAQHEVRHRGDRWQRLAAKAVRQDRGQIVGPADLARGVTLDRQPRIVRVHPFPVVLDPDLLLAAEFDMDGDAPRAGVDGVLDEFLDDGRGALDDFASRDLVGKIIGEAADPSHLRSSAGRGRTPAWTR